MKRLSEYRDEEALEILADLMEPVAEALQDKTIVEMINNGSNNLKVVAYLLKNHKKEVIKVLALLEGVPVEEYHCNIISLPKQVLDILNDKDLRDFFQSQGQMMEEKTSGSVMENTEAIEK